MSNTRKVVQISLNTINKVKNFVNKIEKVECDCDLASRKVSENVPSVDADYQYVVDAKSFSLDLSKTLDLIIYANDDFQLQAALKVVAPFMVTGGN